MGKFVIFYQTCRQWYTNSSDEAMYQSCLGIATFTLSRCSWSSAAYSYFIGCVKTLSWNEGIVHQCILQMIHLWFIKVILRIVIVSVIEGSFDFDCKRLNGIAFCYFQFFWPLFHIFRINVGSIFKIVEILWTIGHHLGQGL